MCINTHKLLMSKRRVDITIEEEQYEWIREHHLNLSSLVREKIEEVREKYEGQLCMFNAGELEKFREMIDEEGLDGLMETVTEVNPEKSKKKRPEEEEEDVIEI
ncbi:hypothetical protein AKJ50_01500 [candidate division MSBL1 archaeon SCGC-AAA382A13]|uniref:Uncharacterized protein n=1 Tax=candidate division MSBL1 archaeon SCGC-AAA382A13 TaxID=1698279 RepID=A0A133VFN2_9EURY|nr:hypothetical protein AKJ50_01500 [candidate division MSBL1 archaeon SCGC-AAA382A13]